MGAFTLVFIVISIAALALYLGVVFWSLWQWRRIPECLPTADFQPSVFLSVLIPARNERANLPACLDALLRQDYPTYLYELIVVDDHSTDGTAEWLRRRYARQVRVLKLSHFLKGRQVKAYKKAALTYGVQQASGELIVTTDADTIAARGWLRQVAYCYEKERPEAIAGPVRYRLGNPWLERFQALDNAAMMVLTGAVLSGGLLVLGNGANLAFPRRVFRRLKGYEGNDHQPSGDDLFLLDKVLRAGGKVRFLKSSGALVDTFPQTGLKALLTQRIRWAGKMVSLRLRSLQGLVFGLYLLIAGWLIAGFLLDSGYLLVALLLWVGKAVPDYFLIRTGTRFLKQPALIRGYGFSAFLYLPYLLWIGFRGLFSKKVRWKGRMLPRAEKGGRAGDRKAQTDIP